MRFFGGMEWFNGFPKNQTRMGDQHQMSTITGLCQHATLMLIATNNKCIHISLLQPSINYHINLMFKRCFFFKLNIILPDSQILSVLSAAEAKTDQIVSKKSEMDPRFFRNKNY